MQSGGSDEEVTIQRAASYSDINIKEHLIGVAVKAKGGVQIGVHIVSISTPWYRMVRAIQNFVTYCLYRYFIQASTNG